MRKLGAITAPLIAGILAFGCGESTVPGNAGFTATIGGDMTEELSGEAIFGVSSEGGVDRWMIFLIDGVFLAQDYDMIGFSREASDTPVGVGAHTIVDATADGLQADDIGGAYWLGRDPATLGIFLSDVGTLNITASSSDMVEGTFSFSATLDFGDGPDIENVLEVTVNGSFTAEPGTIPSVATTGG